MTDAEIGASLHALVDEFVPSLQRSIASVNAEIAARPEVQHDMPANFHLAVDIVVKTMASKAPTPEQRADMANQLGHLMGRATVFRDLCALLRSAKSGTVMYARANSGLVLEVSSASYEECECLPGEAVPERPLDPGFMSDRDWQQHFESNPLLYPPVRDID